MNYNENIWIDTRLNGDEIEFLWEMIAKNEDEPVIGNKYFSKSRSIEDEKEWFFQTTLKTITEKKFNDDEKSSEKKEKPQFRLVDFWVNYQKQNEFVSLHNHPGLYSFVVFIQIPTHWKEQHAVPFFGDTPPKPIEGSFVKPYASDFQFLWSEKNSQLCKYESIPLCPDDEGRMLFFPSWLHHQVYPFFGTNRYRITIAGTIDVITE